jgi:hypothetical protein
VPIQLLIPGRPPSSAPPRVFPDIEKVCYEKFQQNMEMKTTVPSGPGV